MKMKKCNKAGCGKVLEANNINFYTNEAHKADGLDNICKECKRKMNKAYRAKKKPHAFHSQSKDYEVQGYMNGYDEIYC